MKDVLIVDALRSPFGAFGGQLAAVSAPSLAAQVIEALLAKNAVEADCIGEVVLGQVLAGGAGQAPARQAMRQAGIPDSVPAMTINKVCGSGLKSVMLAADSIRLGELELAVAGGMESMSLAPYALPGARFGYRLGGGEMLDLLLHDGLLDPDSRRHMGEMTEDWVRRHGLSREDQDSYAETSYRRAQQANSEGLFAAEIAPVVVRDRRGEESVERDEEPFKVDFARLPQLKSVFSKEGTITAGNASSINDGAGAALLAEEAAAVRLGLEPRARLVAQATFSMAPEMFAEAPVGGIRRVLDRAGLCVADIDLFEINEAFSAVPLVAMRQLDLDPDKVNVNGGAVSIGHPIGASGARLLATLVRELRHRRQRYGLATLCIGGGEAVAVVVEAL